jgi:hypothetical protein
MAQVLLLNPRSRRRASAGGKKRRATSRRRRNPIGALRRSYSSLTRRSPKRRAARSTRRRRNPIGLGMGSTRGLFGQVMPAVIGAAGAVAIDALYAKISPHLPASLQRVPGKVGVGDVAKLALTLVAGKMLNKATRGFSQKAAAGAVLVQAYNMIANMVPPGTLGWYSPYPVMASNQRIGPTRMGAFVPGRTPLLAGARVSAYTSAPSPLLSGVNPARAREGFIR